MITMIVKISNYDYDETMIIMTINILCNDSFYRVGTV